RRTDPEDLAVAANDPQLLANREASGVLATFGRHVGERPDRRWPAAPRPLREPLAAPRTDPQLRATREASGVRATFGRHVGERPDRGWPAARRPLDSAPTAGTEHQQGREGERRRSTPRAPMIRAQGCVV